MNLRITACAFGALVAFGSSVAAQSSPEEGLVACEKRLAYANGEAIDPRNLRVGDTLVDTLVPGIQYRIRPGTTPREACEMFEPVRKKIAHQKLLVAAAEKRHSDAVEDAREDAAFRESIESDLLYNHMQMLLSIAVAAGFLAGLFVREIVNGTVRVLSGNRRQRFARPSGSPFY